MVHWSFDGWQTTQDTKTRDTVMSVFVADLPSENLNVGNEIAFTFLWAEDNRWDGTNYSVVVE